MIFYSVNILIFFVYSFLVDTHLKNQRIYFWLIWCHLSFLMGLRTYYVGTDTYQYVCYYLNQNNGFNGNGAMLYSLLSRSVFAVFKDNYQVFLLILSFLTVFLILKSIELLNDDGNLFTAVFIYLTFYFYFESFNIQRQMLAVSIACFAMALLSKKRIFWSILLFTFAVGIHSTAIFAVIGYVIWYIKKSKLLLSITILMAALSNFFLSNVLASFSDIFDHYIMYTDTVLESGGGTLVLGIFLLLLIVVAVFSTEILTDQTLGFATFMTAIGAVLYIVGMRSQLIIRMANYFAIYSVIFIPNMIRLLSQRFTHQRIWYLGFSVALLIVGSVIFYYKLANNLGEIVPYTFNSI